MAGFLDTVRGLLGQADQNAFPMQSFGGLLSPEQSQQSQQQARLAAGGSLLSASGPTTSPTNPMANLAQALQAGNQSQQGFGLQELQQQLLLAQIGGIKAQGRKDLATAQQTGSGLFQGTGMTQQAMNVITRKANGEDVDPTQFALAKAHLERPETIAGPDGTITREGIDVDAAMARIQSGTSPEDVVSSASQGGSSFAPRVPSEGESARTTAAASLLNQENNLTRTVETFPDFNPESIYEAFKGILNPTASAPFQQYENAKSQWAVQKTKLMSGVAVRPEELQTSLNDFFPEPGDKPSTVAAVTIARLQENITALKAATQPVIHPETGELIPPRMSVFDSEREIAEMEKRLAEAEKAFQRLTSSGSGSDLPEGVTEADIRHTMNKHNITRAEVLRRIR